MIVCREKRVLSNSMDVAKLLKSILFMQDPVSRDKEHFWTIHLNARHRVKFVELISVGCLTSSIVHPREVFRRAVKSGSAAVILGHNHPSGDVTPSQEDIGLTERLTQAGSLIGIRVLDHVIIGSRGFQSLMEGG